MEIPRTPESVAIQAIKDGVQHSEYTAWCRANGFMPVNHIEWDGLAKAYHSNYIFN